MVICNPLTASPQVFTLGFSAADKPPSNSRLATKTTKRFLRTVFGRFIEPSQPLNDRCEKDERAAESGCLNLPFGCLTVYRNHDHLQPSCITAALLSESGGEGMRGDDNQQEGIFSYISPEKRVPTEHPLRPIRKMVDEILKEMSPQFAKLYSSVGRPSTAQYSEKLRFG